MKNMKKFAALLLTAAMTVAMVGCGSSVAANTVNSKDDLPGKKIGVQLEQPEMPMQQHMRTKEAP